MKNNMLKLILILIACFFSMNNAFAYSNLSEYNDNTWAEFITQNEIGSESAIEVHIKNQSDLAAYLTRTGNDLSGDMIWLDNNEDIVFPTGKYIFNARTEFYLTESSGNIDFNNSSFVIGKKGGIWSIAIGNQNNRSYKNLVVYGSVNAEIGDTGRGYYNSGANLTRVGATNSYESQAYYFQALKASNMKFENLEFNNAQFDNHHIFDVMGCNNLTFENITNRGYIENWNNDELRQLRSVHAHTIYTEMIQIDVSNSGALGQKVFLSNDFKNNIFKAELYSDAIATKNTTVTNVRSVGYSGITGQAIIDGTNEKTFKPFGSSIGAHTMRNDAYVGININNNYFENNAFINGINGSVYPPIHFIIVSIDTRDLRDSASTTEEKNALVRNDAVWNATDINIRDNAFINCYPGYENPNYINTKYEGSVYLTSFDPNKKEINETILIDENNNVITRYEGYYPEEYTHDDYVFIQSSYNYDNGILTRKYRKKKSVVIDKTSNNIDKEGNILNDITNYKLTSTRTEKATVEALPNGDTIMVRYINNVYEKNADKKSESQKTNNSTNNNIENPPTGIKSYLIISIILIIISIIGYRLFKNKVFMKL